MVVIDDPEEIKGTLSQYNVKAKLTKKLMVSWKITLWMSYTSYLSLKRSKGTMCRRLSSATAENNNGDFIKDDTPTNEEPDYMFKATKERTAARIQLTWKRR